MYGTRVHASRCVVKMPSSRARTKNATASTASPSSDGAGAGAESAAGGPAGAAACTLRRKVQKSRRASWAVWLMPCMPCREVRRQGRWVQSGPTSFPLLALPPSLQRRSLLTDLLGFSYHVHRNRSPPKGLGNRLMLTKTCVHHCFLRLHHPCEWYYFFCGLTMVCGLACRAACILGVICFATCSSIALQLDLPEDLQRKHEPRAPVWPPQYEARPLLHFLIVNLFFR